MPKVIVPVGFDGGPEWPDEPADAPLHYEVIRGDDSVQLPEDAYLIWGAALVDRQAHAEVRFGRSDLLRLTSDDQRIQQPEATIERLITSGLLVEYDPADCLPFLRNYRLYPLAEGAGNTRENPVMYRLSRAGSVMLELYHDAYAIWQGSMNASSIWDGVERYGKALPSEGTLTTEQLTEMYARAIPVILATRCGFLQPS